MRLVYINLSQNSAEQAYYHLNRIEGRATVQDILQRFRTFLSGDNS